MWMGEVAEQLRLQADAIEEQQQRVGSLAECGGAVLARAGREQVEQRFPGIHLCRISGPRRAESDVRAGGGDDRTRGGLRGQDSGVDDQVVVGGEFVTEAVEALEVVASVAVGVVDRLLGFFGR